MTHEEYQLFVLFEQSKFVSETPIYIGSGEDFCLEMFNSHIEEQMENVE